MNRIILTKTIVLTEFVFHLKNLSAVCTDDTHKNGRLFRGGSIYIHFIWETFFFGVKRNKKQPREIPPEKASYVFFRKDGVADVTYEIRVPWLPPLGSFQKPTSSKTPFVRNHVGTKKRVRITENTESRKI